MSFGARRTSCVHTLCLAEVAFHSARHPTPRESVCTSVVGPEQLAFPPRVGKYTGNGYPLSAHLRKQRTRGGAETVVLFADCHFGLDSRGVRCGNETSLEPQLGTDLTSSASQFDLLTAGTSASADKADELLETT